MKILIALTLTAILLSGCGSTIRLDYAGKFGSVGGGITLPERRGLEK